MSACPSCGFKKASAAHEREASRCPRCGRGPEPEGSIAPAVAFLVGLLALLILVVGLAARGGPAGIWLIITGAALLAGCAAVIVKAARGKGA